MKILLAVPDRDLLAAYKVLLENDSHEVTTAFDGTQVVQRTAGSRFDLVILDQNIPRISSKLILQSLSDSGVAVILLLSRHVKASDLLDPITPCSYLHFPFFFSDLKARVSDIDEKLRSKRKLEVGGFYIDSSLFKSSDGTRFTNEEINLLSDISEGRKPQLRHISAYINSLNNKFERHNKNVRVKYVLNEGYRLVNFNE